MSFNKRHLDSRQSGAGIDQNAFAQTRLAKYFYDTFGTQPLAGVSTGLPTTPSGSTGATNLLTSPQAGYEYFILGAGQTITAPVWSAANGLDFGLDQASTEGAELSAGIGALSKGTFVIGTDRAFYVEMSINLPDASGVSELMLGFRINQAYQAAHTSYTDYAAIGLFTSANPGLIQTKTRLNSGTASLVSTTNTWADAATKILRVVVKDDGYARFYLNGSEPAVTQTNFKFDSGDSVNWFFRFLHSADLADNVYIRYITQGYDRRRGE